MYIKRERYLAKIRPFYGVDLKDKYVQISYEDASENGENNEKIYWCAYAMHPFLTGCSIGKTGDKYTFCYGRASINSCVFSNGYG